MNLLSISYHHRFEYQTKVVRTLDRDIIAYPSKSAQENDCPKIKIHARTTEGVSIPAHSAMEFRRAQFSALQKTDK